MDISQIEKRAIQLAIDAEEATSRGGDWCLDWGEIRDLRIKIAKLESPIPFDTLDTISEINMRLDMLESAYFDHMQSEGDEWRRPR